MKHKYKILSTLLLSLLLIISTLYVGNDTKAKENGELTHTCNHNWVAQTKVVHHEAIGHMETTYTNIDANGNDYGANVTVHIVNGKRCVEVGSDWYDQCGVCGIKFYASAYGGSDQAAAQAMADHRWSVHDGVANDIISSEPIYVEVFYKEIAIFVEDKAAYDETVTTGYKCSICGATKNEESSFSGMAHVQTYGDTPGTYKDGVLTLGTTGQSKRLESIIINLENNTGYEGSIQYRVHRQTYGWTDWVNAGKPAGTTGQSKRLEGIQIRLTGELAKHYSIKYRVHIQTYGWNQGWQYDGALAGTEGEAKRLESLEVQLVPKTEDMGLIYRVHRQTYGWEMPYKSNGTVSGTTGQSKRLEGIEIALTGNKYSGNIIYSTHVQSYGWMKEVSDGMMSGTSGESKRLESIKIRLEGEVANHYDIYYRVHAQSYGWLGWAKNGAPSGTAGYSKRLEAIQILLVEKGASAPTKIAGIESDTTSAFIDKSVIDTCNHNWVAQTKVVHHDAVGHMETKGTYIDANGNDYGNLTQWTIVDGKTCVQVGSDPYYICNACGTKFYHRDYGGIEGAGTALSDHKFSVGHGSSSAYADPIYVEVFYKEIAVFVEDKPAYDETVTTGYKCNICGATK